MSTIGPFARRILRAVGYSASVLLPLLLLCDLSGGFPEDWSLHLWTVGYAGDYFRQHGTLPTVMNIPSAVGMAVPVFYTWLVYPVIGLLAAAVGAVMALRLVILAMVAIQFWAVLSAGRKIFGQTRMAYVVAVSVIWSTYSLSNLYNRGAIAEYLATGFFVTALASGASAAMVPAGSSRWFHGWLAGFFLILTVGTHAPTTVSAAAFVALLAIGLGAAWLRGHLKIPAGTWVRLGLVGLVGAVILSPWIYATVKWASKLTVSETWSGFHFRLDSTDTFWGRFAPFPYDPLSTEDGIFGGGTAYLEAPINFVLLVLLLWNLELCRRDAARRPARAGIFSSSPSRELLTVAIGLFLFLAAISVSPGLASGFRFFAPYIQYVYRLVTHCNAALLLAVFVSGAWVARFGGYRRDRHQTNLVLAVCLTVAVLGLWIKLQHGAIVISPSGPRADSAMRREAELAPVFTLPAMARELTDDDLRQVPGLNFSVTDSGAHFGEIGPANIDMKRAAWVRTNAVMFPWMKLEIDGREAGASQLARVDYFQAVYLPPGAHEVRAVWRPELAWSFLHRLSLACFLLALVGTVAWAAARGFRAGLKGTAQSSRI